MKLNLSYNEIITFLLESFIFIIDLNLGSVFI